MKIHWAISGSNFILEPRYRCEVSSSKQFTNKMPIVNTLIENGNVMPFFNYQIGKDHKGVITPRFGEGRGVVLS